MLTIIESPQENSLKPTKGLFKAMLSDQGSEKARSYLLEEESALLKFMQTTPGVSGMDFCVVGGGCFQYLSLAKIFCKSYILVEPNLDLFADQKVVDTLCSSENVRCFRDKFEGYCEKELLNSYNGNTFYVFWFNVISYIDNPVGLIKKHTKKGDIVFFSTWRDIPKSQEIMSSYLDYINGHSDIYEKFELPRIKAKEIDELRLLYKFEHTINEATEILILHV